MIGEKDKVLLSGSDIFRLPKDNNVLFKLVDGGYKGEERTVNWVDVDKEV